MVSDHFTDGPRFAAFCEDYVIQTKGRWGGRPLVLEPWQRDFWWEALELDPTSGLRVYQEVGLGIPTKNGKSTMASASGAYGLIADGENEPEVYVGAAARGQATIVLGQSRSMVLRSPRLRDHIVPRMHHLECPKNGGIMRALASDGALQHGLNPSWNILDELHAHKNDDLYTALTKSGGAREQPFTIWISTAGPLDRGILHPIYEQAFSGEGERVQVSDYHWVYRDRKAGILIHWYGAPREADIEDPLVWLGVNPASWRTEEVLRREYQRTKARGAILEWRMYHLNQWLDTEASWLPAGAWSALAEGAPDADDPWHGLDSALPVGVGIEKSATSDAAAIAVSQRQGERVVIRVQHFAAGATGAVSLEAMRVALRELRGRFEVPQARDPKTQRPHPGPAFAFDRWAFAESAIDLEAEGLNMVEFPQTASALGPASTQAFELITTGRLVHDGDPILARHVETTEALLTERGMKVQKGRAHPNHGCIAMVMSTAMAMQEAPKVFTRTPRAAASF